MILQSIRWMNLKIGEHLDMKISYKILRLELFQTLSSFDFQLAIKGGYFLAVLTKAMPRTLGVNFMCKLKMEGGDYVMDNILRIHL